MNQEIVSHRVNMLRAEVTGVMLGLAEYIGESIQVERAAAACLRIVVTAKEYQRKKLLLSAMAHLLDHGNDLGDSFAIDILQDLMNPKVVTE